MDFAPLFRSGKLTVKPTLVKNASMKKSCSVPSKVICITPAAAKIVFSSAKTRPPTTGAGIQYFLKNLIWSTIQIPSQYTMAPIPAAKYRSSFTSNINRLLLQYNFW